MQEVQCIGFNYVMSLLRGGDDILTPAYEAMPHPAIPHSIWLLEEPCMKTMHVGRGEIKAGQSKR